MFLQGDRHDHENVKNMVMGMIKHSQSTQSNTFAISSQYLQFAMSLQHLQKEVINGVHFGVHQDKNLFKLDYWFLMKVARHVQIPKKR